MISPQGSGATRAWLGFARTFLVAALALVGLLYAFVAIVDPWDTLPLSPRWPRVPISGNARFSFPALARSPRFDAAVLGTSTARLLRPEDLDAAFAARFVNLSMNSATPWEQTQLLHVFLRAHPHPAAVVIDVDEVWCALTTERLTPRPFPEWMYGRSRWAGYLHLLTPYAVQEAANQAAVLLHWKRPRYGLDGYTSFVPPDSEYDPVRVDAAFARREPIDQVPGRPGDVQLFPALALLGPALADIPSATRVVLLFPPEHVVRQGAPGSGTWLRWQACKREVAAIAGGRATVLDMLIPSAITQDRANYWDPLHYRVAVARRIAALLSGATGEDGMRLTAAPSPR